MNTLKKILFMLTLSGAQKGAQSGVASAVDWVFLGFNKEKTPWTLQNPRRFFMIQFFFDFVENLAWRRVFSRKIKDLLQIAKKGKALRKVKGKALKER